MEYLPSVSPYRILDSRVDRNELAYGKPEPCHGKASYSMSRAPYEYGGGWGKRGYALGVRQASPATVRLLTP